VTVASDGGRELTAATAALVTAADTNAAAATASQPLMEYARQRFR